MGWRGTRYVTDLRRNAEKAILAALGEQRLRELRAQGEAMDTDQACRYARTLIHDYLANAEEPT